MAKYLAIIEKETEIKKPVSTLSEAWAWFCSEYKNFAGFFETPGQFRYWYGHRRGVGIASHIVKAGRLLDDDRNELFRFRVERIVT